MNDDFALYLDLFSPSPVEGRKLLLGSQTIVQDALNVLSNTQSLQAVGRR